MTLLLDWFSNLPITCHGDGGRRYRGDKLLSRKQPTLRLPCTAHHWSNATNKKPLTRHCLPRYQQVVTPDCAISRNINRLHAFVFIVKKPFNYGDMSIFEVWSYDYTYVFIRYGDIAIPLNRKPFHRSTAFLATAITDIPVHHSHANNNHQVFLWLLTLGR